MTIPTSVTKLARTDFSIRVGREHHTTRALLQRSRWARVSVPSYLELLFGTVVRHCRWDMAPIWFFMPSTRPEVEILPPVSRSEELADLEWLVDLMDFRFQIPGLRVRVGLDALLGLVPGLGDALSAVVSAYIYQRLQKQNLPWHVQARMVGNILLDFATGAIPIVGDLVDVGFKANRRNLALARRHLAKRTASR